MQTADCYRIGVLYATREGQTKRIAEHAAARLRARGMDVELRSLREEMQRINLAGYSAVILGASVHAGQHEAEAVNFVKANLARLNSMPTAFLSVTLSEAGAERRNATLEEHVRFTADVQKMLDNFFQRTKWHPTHTKPVAGALQYSKYNVLVRFVMKRIARKAGAETDTSRDYEYTDWPELDRFVDEFAAEIAASRHLTSA